MFQTLNFELTKLYLDLVVTYITLMILLSRVEDRKAVLGLFNAAHEMVHNQKYVFRKTVWDSYILYGLTEEKSMTRAKY